MPQTFSRRHISTALIVAAGLSFVALFYLTFAPIPGVHGLRLAALIGTSGFVIAAVLVRSWGARKAQ